MPPALAGVVGMRIGDVVDSLRPSVIPAARLAPDIARLPVGGPMPATRRFAPPHSRTRSLVVPLQTSKSFQRLMGQSPGRGGRVWQGGLMADSVDPPLMYLVELMRPDPGGPPWWQASSIGDPGHIASALEELAVRAGRELTGCGSGLCWYRYLALWPDGRVRDSVQGMADPDSAITALRTLADEVSSRPPGPVIADDHCVPVVSRASRAAERSGGPLIEHTTRSPLHHGQR